MKKNNQFILPNKNIKKLFLVNAIVLALACLPMPYGFYTFIRFVVCLISSLIVYNYFIKKKPFDQIIILSLIAILFNPVFPIFLNNKWLWILIDLGLSIYFFKLYSKK
ncbi:DUF6804 family protein [Empedobacter falsenii]|uniref:DUF6804 family protein n=1 Tax=Empedobacter falsenii TaxID=343874 RepID=UPI0005715EC5